MEKISVYKELVKERKNCKICYAFGYCNSSLSKYDTDEIGSFSEWANDLNAEIIIVGQDFCDIDSFIKFEGTVQMKEISNLDIPNEYDTVTNF